LLDLQRLRAPPASLVLDRGDLRLVSKTLERTAHMTAPIANNEPFQLRAGDTWVWNRQDLANDYPAPTWTLKYAFKNAVQHFELTAAADGTFFAASVAMSTTANYVAGKYSWVAWVETASERHEVDRGWLTVLPAFTGTTVLDDRSHARKVLEALEALIEGKATADQMEYTIGSRSLKRIPPADLITWRDKYRGLVFAEDAAERRRNGYGAGRLVAKL
jgi:hypothetical protein